VEKRVVEGYLSGPHQIFGRDLPVHRCDDFDAEKVGALLELVREEQQLRHHLQEVFYCALLLLTRLCSFSSLCISPCLSCCSRHLSCAHSHGERACRSSSHAQQPNPSSSEVIPNETTRCSEEFKQQEQPYRDGCRHICRSDHVAWGGALALPIQVVVLEVLQVVVLNVTEIKACIRDSRLLFERHVDETLDPLDGDEGHAIEMDRGRGCHGVEVVCPDLGIGHVSIGQTASSSILEDWMSTERSEWSVGQVRRD
jgi:hypothetical protein